MPHGKKLEIEMALQATHQRGTGEADQHTVYLATLEGMHNLQCQCECF
jgi:hypothetical protein